MPIFSGAVQDGSIFLNAVRLQREDPAFLFRIDAGRDVYQMAALQNLARAGGGKAAIWILGGGVPKNYTLQGEPLLSQILGVEARGFDYDAQVCVDVVDNGALSPCSAGRGTLGEDQRRVRRVFLGLPPDRRHDRGTVPGRGTALRPRAAPRAEADVPAAGGGRAGARRALAEGLSGTRDCGAGSGGLS